MARIGIPFLIEVRSPLHIGIAPMGEGEYLLTQPSIPGSALRGALAEVLIEGGMDPESAAFRSLFDGDRAVRFEPAYPSTSTTQGYPFPLTARWCKAKSGFPPPEVSPSQWGDYHGAFDILVSQFVFEEQVAQMEKGTPLPFLEKPRCPHCWGSVEPAKGSYIWDEVSDQPSAAPRTDLARHTHTAINRARGVAEDGMLYTVETIEPGTLLRGHVWVEDGEADRVRDALGRITRLGRGTRRGQGRVAMEPLADPPTDGVRARIEALTALVRKERAFYAHLYNRPEPKEDEYYFTLDLLSPAVFGDGVAAKLEPDDWGLPEGVTLVRRFVATKVVGGWWTVARLPHPTALAVSEGSVFLFKAPAGTDLDRLAARLDQLRAEGIGQLRERGYGAVVACAPFHLWTTEKEAER